MGLQGLPPGSSVYTKRIASPGKGKSGGYRTILVFRKKDSVIFVEGYAKNEMSTLKPKELRALRQGGNGYVEVDQQGVRYTREPGRFRGDS